MIEEVVARLHAYLRDHAAQGYHPHVITVPPFLLFLNINDPSLGASYAMPDKPIDGEVDELLISLFARFREYERLPYFRFLAEAAPALAPALQARNFNEVGRFPVMSCTSSTLRQAPEVPGLTLVTLSTESPLEDVRESWTVNAQGYDPTAAPATAAQAEEFRQSLVTSRAFVARLHGHGVSAGMYTASQQGVTELVGIATLEPFRRRGIASVLTAYMTQTAFDHGVEVVFLIAETAQAGRVYERIGFQHYGTLFRYATSEEK